MGIYGNLISIIRDMIAFFEEFSLLEQKKLDAIMAGNTELLEEYMKSAQAYSMKMRGLEQNREKIMEKLGLTNESFKAIVKDPQNDEQIELAKVYTTLGTKLTEFRENSDIIKKQIELKLHSIKVILEKLEHSQNGNIYNKTGQENVVPNTEFKSTKV